MEYIVLTPKNAFFFLFFGSKSWVRIGFWWIWTTSEKRKKVFFLVLFSDPIFERSRVCIGFWWVWGTSPSTCVYKAKCKNIAFLYFFGFLRAKFSPKNLEFVLVFDGYGRHPKNWEKFVLFSGFFLYVYFRLWYKKCYFPRCRESGHRLPLSPLPRLHCLHASGPIWLHTSLWPLGRPPIISKKSPFWLQKWGPFFYFFCKILSLYGFVIPMDDIEKSLKMTLF